MRVVNDQPFFPFIRQCSAHSSVRPIKMFNELTQTENRIENALKLKFRNVKAHLHSHFRHREWKPNSECEKVKGLVFFRVFRACNGNAAVFFRCSFLFLLSFCLLSVCCFLCLPFGLTKNMCVARFVGRTWAVCITLTM